MQSGFVPGGLWLALTEPGLAAHDNVQSCCADLDERVAELEAMAVRKGNRKVSLTISGWVNEALFMWDDGTDKDAYIGTNFVEQSRFRFVGEAKLDKDWSAGYLLEIGVAGHPSNQWDQDGPRSASLNPANREFALNLRKSNWYLKSKRLGQAALGLNAMATYHLLDDADSTLTRNVNDVEGAAIFLAAFRVRIDGQFVNGLKWVDVMRGIANSTPGDGLRRDVIRYDTPTIAGFTASASWGENTSETLRSSTKMTSATLVCSPMRVMAGAPIPALPCSCLTREASTWEAPPASPTPTPTCWSSRDA